MLRPIDTQTVYQQTQEVAGRQQALEQELEMQQNQFANILHKETAQKQESVNELEKEEMIKNHLKKEKHQTSQKDKKEKNKKDKNGKKDKDEKEHSAHIDIRI